VHWAAIEAGLKFWLWNINLAGAIVTPQICMYDIVCGLIRSDAVTKSYCKSTRLCNSPPVSMYDEVLQYLTDCCIPVSDIASCQQVTTLWFCMPLPHYQHRTLCCRAFSVTGPTVPDKLRDPCCSEISFKESLKMWPLFVDSFWDGRWLDEHY